MKRTILLSMLVAGIAASSYALTTETVNVVKNDAEQEVPMAWSAAEEKGVTESNIFLHPWQGKRIAYFGDSITDPRVKAGTDKWWTLLSEWLNATSYCYAISGRQWNDIPRQANALLNEHGQNFDAILIFMGTNDYNHAIPLGEWFDIEERDGSV